MGGGATTPRRPPPPHPPIPATHQDDGRVVVGVGWGRGYHTTTPTSLPPARSTHLGPPHISPPPHNATHQDDGVVVGDDAAVHWLVEGPRVLVLLQGGGGGGGGKAPRGGGRGTGGGVDSLWGGGAEHTSPQAGPGQLGREAGWPGLLLGAGRRASRCRAGPLSCRAAPVSSSQASNTLPAAANPAEWIDLFGQRLPRLLAIPHCLWLGACLWSPRCNTGLHWSTLVYTGLHWSTLVYTGLH